MSRGSVLMTWPKTTWPICSPSTPERSSASRAAAAASRSAESRRGCRRRCRSQSGRRRAARYRWSWFPPRLAMPAQGGAAPSDRKRRQRRPEPPRWGRRLAFKAAALRVSSLYRTAGRAAPGAECRSSSSSTTGIWPALGRFPRPAEHELRDGAHPARGLRGATGAGVRGAGARHGAARGPGARRRRFATYRNPEIPIIAVTARGFFSDSAIFELIPNARGLLRAPLRPEDMAALVEHYGSRPPPPPRATAPRRVSFRATVRRGSAPVDRRADRNDAATDSGSGDWHSSAVVMCSKSTVAATPGHW